MLDETTTEHVEEDHRMIPSVGRIVHYQLSEGDVHAIHRQRALRSKVVAEATNVSALESELRKASFWEFGFGGNAVSEGDIYPALIVRTWGSFALEAAVQLQVFLDGGDTYWATSRQQTSHKDNSPEFGRWHQPVRV